MIGMVIQNRYEIQKSIGEDRLGLIYKGWDRKLERNITIKVLKESLGEDLAFILERVQFLYGLNNKNIIKFYDSGVEHKLHYVINEYIDGFTLKEFMLKHHLKEPVIYSVQFCFHVCQALQYAHKNYFFHGELNPDNIMIANNGIIKLNNFGLLKLEGEAIGGSSKDALKLDPYLSPEQLKGEEVDYRTDIYSLGLILYELLSGHSICDETDPLSFTGKEKEPVPLRKYNDNIPKELEDIVMKTLRKDREERFQRVGEILGELYKVKYKGDKPVIQEIFPDIDFSNMSPSREIPDKKPPEINPVEKQQAKPSPIDKKNVEQSDYATRKIKLEKLDFRVLDVMCHGTGIRYKEARDALIQTGGDALKAIEIIARRRKGVEVEPESDEEDKIEIQETCDDTSNDLISNLFNGIILIRKNSGEELIHFSTRFLLLLPFFSLPLVYVTIPTIIILFCGIFALLFVNPKFELTDIDTYEFRKRVELTLISLGMGSKAEPSLIPQDLPSAFLPAEISEVLPEPEVKREKVRSRAKDKEKAPPEEVKEEEAVSVPQDKGEDETRKERVRGRDRAEKRKREREMKKEEEQIAPKVEEQPDPDLEKIEYICSRIDGVTPEEAREALKEADGDQNKVVMNLKKKRRKERKVSPTSEETPPPPPPEEEKKEEIPETPQEEPPPKAEETVEAPTKGGEDFPQEKIDYVCRRTKVSPEEAKQALEENLGDEIEAVMSIKKKKRKSRR